MLEGLLAQLPPPPMIPAPPQKTEPEPKAQNKTAPLLETEPLFIKCRDCLQFKCYNQHGGGAGICHAGVQSSGVCRWADTVHQCGKYQLNLFADKSRSVTDGS